MTDERTCPRCGVEFIGWSGTRRFERCDTQANQPMHTDARCADRLAARLRELERLARDVVTAFKPIGEVTGAALYVGVPGIEVERRIYALDAAAKGGG